MMPMRGWMLSILVALVLWPAVAYGQSPELKDAFALYKKLNAEGRHQEALPFAEITLRWARREFGADHPEVATTLNNLAELYRAQGRYAEAEPLLKRALAINEKALGPEHPRVATSLENCAALLRKTGRTAEATKMEARAKSVGATRAK